MIFDPDEFLKGGAPKPQAFDPDAFLKGDGANVPHGTIPTPQAAPVAPDWNNLYAGLEGIDQRVNGPQKAAFAQLDGVSADPKEARAMAVNQSYLQSRMPNLDPGMVRNNWQAVKDGFVKNELGMDEKGMSDTKLYGYIGAKMQDEADPTGTKAITPGAFWKALNTPFKELPDAPKNMPNIPALASLNPAVMAGVYNGIKPLLEGAESPLGLATAGIGAELKTLGETYPLAHKALIGMTGFFAGIMGRQAIADLPEMHRVLADPNSTLQDKISAVARPAADAAASLLASLGTAFEALPEAEAPKIVRAMQNKTPGQAAQILRGEAATVQPGPHSDFLNHAANELESVDAGRVKVASQTEPSAGGFKGTAKPIPFEPPPPDEPVYPVERGDGVHEWQMPSEDDGHGIGINRASMDRELDEMGLPPTTEAETKQFDEGLENAAAKMKRDPDAGQKLVEKLDKNPRPMTDDEVALMAREMNRLRLERDEADADLKDAAGTPEEAAARAKVAAIRDDFQHTADVITRSKTQNARGLAFMRIMVKEDYSRAGIESRYQTANGGKPLKEETYDEIGDLHDQLVRTQKAFDDYREKQGAVNAAKAARQAPKRPGPPPSGVSKFLSDKAAEARKRIQQRAAGAQVMDITNIPAAAADLAIVGADYIARMSAKGAVKFSEWAEAMAKEFGDQIRPHLKDIFNKAIQERDDASRLQALKTRTATSTAKMEAKLAAGDFSKDERRPVPLDRKAMELKAENARVKRLIDLGQKRLEAQNRSTMDKVKDAFTGWVRMGALSTPTVIEHITGASLLRPLATAMEQGVGWGISKVLPELAARAPREGVPTIGGALRAEAKAYTSGIMRGLRGVGDALRNRDTEESAMFDKAHLPPEMIEYMGQIHKALHYPTQMMELERSLQLRSEHAMKNEVDPHDPIQQIRLLHEAYMDSNRVVGLNDNVISKGYEAVIRTLEAKDKVTGKASIMGQVIATGLKVEMPVVKVPTNMVLEAFDAITGAFHGGARAAWAYTKGHVKDLTPDEADQIMRLLKKGSVGVVMTYIGYLDYKNIGGSYDPNVKQKKGDLQTGDVKVGDKEIPGGLMHNPVLGSTVIMGATMHRAADAALKIHGVTLPGVVGRSLLAGSLGLVGNTPFIKETSAIGKYMNTREAGNAIDTKAASVLVPGGIAWLAAVMDKKNPADPSEKPTPRKAEDLGDAIKKDIPGLRQTLPKGRQH